MAGKVAIITGGGSGICRAAAFSLLKRGYRVALAMVVWAVMLVR